ncbi:glycerol-3-phosphate dehydrogenase [Vibrio comitans]|uniref:Glycerol-3-phosphate dehydrogenase n=1 Tax=Vibrio comitans NBRC 102076 TaxID=1219078 RepID=A0A4Y3IQV9_9VIBR|nr:glycerol-3-phosphate dehydrogenase [Vibrio comitans]GEA61208.1 glycerol-3-phosphate dehydrogenase [Vibrio comitans NBRC 102076]
MTNINETFDMIIVGGGINGAGIAADAAGRGLQVALFEANDFASATSSTSSKLIHGGLRYLEHYEFRLVSEALAEREVILNKAPHITKPMRFRLPHRPFLRPAWMIRSGLFLYDILASRNTLPGTRTVNLSQSGMFVDAIKKGFEYSDCWVDDARLVIANILDAQRRGALTYNYSEVTSTQQVDGLWRVTVLDKRSGKSTNYYARSLVNAAGPWVESFIKGQMQRESPRSIRLVKGSHIIVPRIHSDEQAYILQNKDMRIVFVIPYLDKYSLVGTTDVEYKGDPRECEISQEETDYLIDIVNQHFVKGICKQNIVSSYAGVRPLCEDESSSPQAITRDYTLELECETDIPPLLSVFGGKLTTYRKLAEAALDKLKPHFTNMDDKWTATSVLPGGDFESFEQLSQQVEKQYPWLSSALAKRYLNQFGCDIHNVLQGVTCESELGNQIAPSLFEAEIRYLVEIEQAYQPQDILKRRTKLGLGYTLEETKAVQDYLDSYIH